MRPFFAPSLRRLKVSRPFQEIACFHMSRSGRWRKDNEARRERRAAATKAYNAKMEANGEGKTDYSAWSQEKLIERVTQLENELKSKNESLTINSPTPEKKSWKKPRHERVFDPSKYSTRLIALKIAYLGKRYGGFEYSGQTRLPTIEDELWKAFNKGRLIFPQGAHPLAPGEVNWDGCEYSKCGRTDRGVSAFGQVVGIRVRSNRPLAKRKEVEVIEEDEGEIVDRDPPKDSFNTLPRAGSIEIGSPPLAPSRRNSQPTPPEIDLTDPDFEEALNFDPIKDEIPYCSLLNRLLPPDIRVLAWCPAPPVDFSARFSCRERQYRYFFTQPVFAPTPSNIESPLPSNKTVATKQKDGWLDIAAMREAAKLFEGVHDFRNFCKVDPGKQITNFTRRIFYADIEEVEDSAGALSFVNGESFRSPEISSTGHPKVYTFTLHGSAFLWHQVRCMVAILFLVGQGLEKPSVVAELLDAEKNPRRPTYEMASDIPLVLWNCVFPHEDDPERKEALDWVYMGDTPGWGDAKYGTAGLVDDLWTVWREKKIDEMLAGTLLGVVTSQGKKAEDLTLERKKGASSQKVFGGGDNPKLQGTYTPVMKKPKMETVDVINEKYAIRKGFEGTEDLRKQGYKRMNKPEKEELGEALLDEAGA